MSLLDELILSQEAEIREAEARLAKLKELKKNERKNSWVTASEAACQLGISYRTIPAWCLDGRLEGKRPGRKWLVSQASIDRYIGGQTQTT